jgi:hypothetical protein
MDEKIQELLKQVDKWNGSVTAEHLEEILKSEETMQQIDAMEKGWLKLHNQAISQELGWKIRNIALERANNFEAYMGFIDEDGIGDIFAAGALFHAETANKCIKVGRSTSSFTICVRAFKKALKMLRSGKEAKDALSGLNFQNKISHLDHPYQELVMGIVKKGATLSKTVDEAGEIYLQGLLCMKERCSPAKAEVALLAAEGLLASEIDYRDKDLLKRQTSLCQGCSRWKNKECSSLMALLSSIIEYDRYQRLSPAHESE